MKRHLKHILKQGTPPPSAAKKAGLSYATDQTKGIERKRIGKKFCYFKKGHKIANKNVLERIRALAIPPPGQRSGFRLQRKHTFKRQDAMHAAANSTAITPNGGPRGMKPSTRG